MNKRIVALDVGDRWIGVAHSDPLQIIAIPYATWEFEKFDSLFSAYLLKNNIKLVIIGLPKTMQGKNSIQTNKILKWYEEVKIRFNHIFFSLQDERLSSQFAKKILFDNKSKKNSDHTVAASIILENFLLYFNKKGEL